MTQPDYRGARGSNAGDDFHELWALRQALALLDQDSALTAVAVEGLRAEDESGTPLDTWDGVDCTFYFGGDQVASAKRLVIDQLKYSGANRDDPWTVSRLTKSTNRKQDNSVIGRLAKAFIGLKEQRPDLIETGNILVRLVSNQPVHSDVFRALTNQSTSNRSTKRGQLPDQRDALLAASGLQDEDFDAFASALDLSECGHGSRFAFEERVLATISDWTDDDARAAVNDLLRFIHRAMLPEGKGEIITRQSVLTWMGFSDPGALFPCPATLKKVERLIPRAVSRIVVEKMLGGEQLICLHGEAGCGKTTALQEVEALLPPGSLIIVFDCYGSGRYLDSDGYRHRPPDAFLQLTNDLARSLRIPLLLSRSRDLDYPRVFKRRLQKASDVVASKNEDALLVIAVDAADNSIIAADMHLPPEPSFVHELVRLGELPPNVRSLVTCRTGRLSTISLPGDYVLLPISGFAEDETAAHVRGFWPEAPDAWVDDFHHLSNGNPRVQQYALNYAGIEPQRALDYLRPSGKALDDVFLEQLKHALQKGGYEQSIKALCAGLVALPRPVPINDLSVVTGLSVASIRDLCSDLAPGVRLTNSTVTFADEDFEQFMRTEADAELGLIRPRIADHFMSRRTSDPYAAAHVGAALFDAGRGREIIDLVRAEPEPDAIRDPVLRRETQLQRLRIAMKVCREAGNNVDAILTLLVGAEALKTDTAIRRIFVENPDLAARFARDSSARFILRDPEQLEHHGPLLFHLMAADARAGDAISVREGYRQMQAWMQRRSQILDEQKRENPDLQPHGWSIGDYAIASEIEAVLRVVGPLQAVDYLLRWRPKSVALRVIFVLSFRLIAEGKDSLVERCLTETGISTPWDLFLLTPLALAGKDVDAPRLEASLSSVLLRRLIKLDALLDNWSRNQVAPRFLEMIVSACEVAIARGCDRERIIPVLERFNDRESRRRDKISLSRATLIDLTLRAHVLLERMAGREPTVESYWTDPPQPQNQMSPKGLERAKRNDNEKKGEMKSFVGPLRSCTTFAHKF